MLCARKAGDRKFEFGMKINKFTEEEEREEDVKERGTKLVSSG